MKAFIFMLDALFAASILGVFLVAVSFELNMPKETSWLPELGNTFMTSLDKSGVFSGMLNQTDDQTRSTMNSYIGALPNNVNANLTVTIYQGKPDDTFDLKSALSVAKRTINPNQSTHIRRVFSCIGNNYYGIADLVLSYE